MIQLYMTVSDWSTINFFNAQHPAKDDNNFTTGDPKYQPAFCNKATSSGITGLMSLWNSAVANRKQLQRQEDIPTHRSQQKLTMCLPQLIGHANCLPASAGQLHQGWKARWHCGIHLYADHQK
jgi:hypothetical protein